MNLHVAVDAREWVRGRQTGIGRHLEAIVRRGIETRPSWSWTFFVVAEHDERVVSESGRYLPLPGKLAPWVDQVVLPRRLRRIAPDVFLSPYIKAPWAAPCPVVATVHDILQLRLPEDEGGLTGPARVWFRWYAGRSLRKANAVLAVSGSSARDATTLLGVPADKIVVAHNQVDPHFRPLPAPPGEGTEVVSGLRTPYFLVVSNFRRHKNIEMLLQAWSELEGMEPRVSLALAGEGSRLPRLQQMARQLGVAEQMHWLGPVDDDLLLILYQHATALLQPSFLEGFGYPVAEALACGTPAVVSGAGSLPEIQGEAGPVLEPNDQRAWVEAVRELATDRARRATLSQRALARAAEFGPEKTTDRVIDLLERLV